MGLWLHAPTCLGYGNLQFYDVHANIVNSLWDERQYNSTLFSNGIPWVLNDQGTRGAVPSLSLSNLQVIVSNSFSTWQAPSETKIRFTYGGLTTNGTPGDGEDGLPPDPVGLDGDNLIVFGGLPSGVLAQTYLFRLTDQFTFTSTNNNFGGTDPDPDIPEGTYPAGTILDADIMVNKAFAQGTQFDFQWSVTDQRRAYDLQAVLTHEIGHFIGLCHSSVRETWVSQATMFPFASKNPEGLESRTLSQDDIAGVGYYYSSPSFASNFGGIAGVVTKGSSPCRGVHVWAVKRNDRTAMVGTYTPANGTYSLRGLPPGEYTLRVEPIPFNGDVINDVFAPYQYMGNFQAHCYGGFAVETSSAAVSVTAGLVTNGYNFALVAGATPDPFEPDNHCTNATLIMPDGGRQIHHFGSAEDVDWFRFTAVSGTTYRIRTLNIVLLVGGISYGWLYSDTVVTLYDTNGVNVLSRNNNLSYSNSRDESYLLFPCVRSGDYYFNVSMNPMFRIDWHDPGADANYDVEVSVTTQAEYYVDAASGSDLTGDGTRTLPWATVQHALDSVTGTVDRSVSLHVARGIYNGPIICDNFESVSGGYDPATWTHDPSNNVTILDGTNGCRVLDLADAMTIDGLTIRNGFLKGGGDGPAGAGCCANGVSGHIINTVFTNNNGGQNTSYGGALALSGFADCLVAHNIFVNNSAGGGGAIRCGDTDAYVADNLFINNRTLTGGGNESSGGAISLRHYSHINASIIGNRFLGNWAVRGGAIHLYDGMSDVIGENVFIANEAYYGGAVSMSASYSMPYIFDNVFSDCNAYYDGGAISADYGGRPTCVANVFAGNNAGRNGGAIYVGNGRIQLLNNILVGNTADYGGAVNGGLCYSQVRCNSFLENVARTNGGALWVPDIGTYSIGPIENNVFAQNTGGGVFESAASADMDIRNNDFYLNSPGAYYDNDTTNWYNSASDINHEVVNPGYQVTNNVACCPQFMTATSGTASSVTLESNTYQSVLADTATSLRPNAFAGLTINPNTNQHRHFLIVTNTTTTITTWGDMTAVATSPCQYRVIDFHLAATSSNINRGVEDSAYWGVSVPDDIDGEARPVGGKFDIGADEFLDSDADTLADVWEMRNGLNATNADTDGDGLPDGWEVAHGVDPLSSNGIDGAHGDLDGDGMDNIAEYLADTDPRNDQSQLAIVGIHFLPDGLHLDWKGGQWARQYIQSRHDLSSTSEVWSSIYTNANLPTAVTNSLAIIPPTNATVFYQIKAER